MADIHSFRLQKLALLSCKACETIFKLRFTPLYFMPKSETIFKINVLHGAVFYFRITGPKSLSDYHSDAYFFCNSVALVRTRTILTERPPPVGEVSTNFCG